MPLTVADWLAVLAPRLTEPLLDFAAVARLRRLAPALPGECQATLELRLGSAAAPVDLSLRLLRGSKVSSLAARLPASPAGRFLSAWSKPDGRLAPVRSVWLEFDLDADAAEAPSPIVCAKLPEGVDPEWLLRTLLPALCGGPLSRNQRGLILSCLDALPASARLLYAFSLRARGGDAVRLETFGLEPGQMLDYLGQVAPGSVAAVAEIAPLFEGVERLHLSLDIDEEVLPRIGLEGSFPRQPKREPRWQALFDRLESRGLCASEKRNAVLGWPGYDTFWTAAERWPVRDLGPDGICVRILSHVKVVCRPAGRPEAKAYLVFGPPDSPSGTVPASSAASRSVFST